jgi:cytidylate kinase
LRGFIGQDTGTPSPVPAESVTSEDFRRATEDAILRQARTGSGVILGRGSVIVLRDDPRVLRVRLDGPHDRRIEQAIALEGIDRDTAERRLRRLDRTHDAYIRHFYGVDLGDPSLYHLVIDSTAIDLDGCVELIALAAAQLTVWRSAEPSGWTSRS